MAENTLSLPARPQCALCKSEDTISRCAGCLVVFYCGRDHQTNDWTQHKTTWTPTKKTRNKLDAEFDALNSMPSTFGFEEKPFENSAGHFWGILDTRDYMRARYAHIEALLKAKTRTAIETALDHSLDILRLNRSDNMGIRSQIPSLYLLLDRDQECYDFAKWWFTCDPDGHYDWGNTDLPYLNIKNANAFEPYDTWRMDYPDLSQLSMLLLVKLRLLFNLEAIERATSATSSKLPTELVDQVRSHIANSAASSNQAFMDDVESGRPLDKYTESLTDQTAMLFAPVKRAYQHYWKGALAPGKHLKARPPYTSPGDVSEMQVSLAQTYDAWAATPGAIQWVRMMK